MWFSNCNILICKLLQQPVCADGDSFPFQLCSMDTQEEAVDFCVVQVPSYLLHSLLLCRSNTFPNGHKNGLGVNHHSQIAPQLLIAADFLLFQT